jgi:hypothetical protein
MGNFLALYLGMINDKQTGEQMKNLDSDEIRTLQVLVEQKIKTLQNIYDKNSSLKMYEACKENFAHICNYKIILNKINKG